MKPRALLLTVSLAALLAGAVLAGCYSSTSPLVSVGDVGYSGGHPRPDVAGYPAGPCRDDLGRALDQIDRLQKDLANCKADRQKDKDKWEARRKDLEQERDGFKAERDRYKKQLSKLGAD